MNKYISKAAFIFALCTSQGIFSMIPQFNTVTIHNKCDEYCEIMADYLTIDPLYKPYLPETKVQRLPSNTSTKHTIIQSPLNGSQRMALIIAGCRESFHTIETEHKATYTIIQNGYYIDVKNEKNKLLARFTLQ